LIVLNYVKCNFFNKGEKKNIIDIYIYKHFFLIE